MTAEPGARTTDPKYNSLCQKVANTLSKVRTPQLTEFIKVGDVIGSGVEGIVRPGVNKESQEIPEVQEPTPQFKELAEKFGDKVLAVKTVEKLGSSYGFTTAQEYREVKVMQELSQTPHPNITSYLHTFESPIRLHIVTEYNQGGDLFTFLQDHDFDRQPEKDVARVMMQLFCAVLYTHESGFAHLDLKLENVMRRRNGPAIDEGGVCLIDFGHASRISTQPSSQSAGLKKLHRPVGSPSYAAPEVVLNKQFSGKSDSWSLGVMMYILLQGYLPFPHLQQKRWREFSVNDYGNFDKGIVENDPFYYTGDWEDISHCAKELCQKLLQVDVNKRIDVAEAINHPWFASNGVSMVQSKEGLPILKEFGPQESSEVSSSVFGFL